MYEHDNTKTNMKELRKEFGTNNSPSQKFLIGQHHQRTRNEQKMKDGTFLLLNCCYRSSRVHDNMYCN